MNANFKINGLQLETDRLLLRAFEKEDLDDFYEYVSVPGVGEMAGWLPHKNREESAEILETFLKGDQVFAVCYKENNKVIGSIALKKYGMEEKLTEFQPYFGRDIGFVLSKAYWGRGLMPEAVLAVIQYVFTKLHWDFLLCGHYDSNTQSCRVQEKCGFRPYRKITIDTKMGTKGQGRLNLLVNPDKNITLHFSHKETLIYQDCFPRYQEIAQS